MNESTLEGTQESREEAIRSHALLFDTPRQAVIATTSTGVISFWNAAAEALYGWQAREVLGRDIVEVISIGQGRRTASDILERLSAGRSWSGEFRARRRDGSELTVFVRDFPVRSDQGELIGIIGLSNPVG